MNYRIGEIADKCDVNKETLRYYERMGLIPEPSRTSSGYRMYTEDTIQRVRFIKRIQDLDFTLKEIDQLLGVVDRDQARSKNMYEFTSKKLQEIDQKIAGLLRTKSLLKNLQKRCPNSDDIFACPIYDFLMKD